MTTGEIVVLDDVDEITQRISNGEVFVYPTDTAYGIGCSIEDEEAVERVFRIKDRDFDKSVPTLLHRTQVDQWAEPDDVERNVMEQLWPGGLTLVMKTRDDRNYHRGLVTSDTIAVRDPDRRLLRSILKGVGPIVGTSANPSGRATPHTLQEVDEELLGRVDFVAEGTPAGTGSSTVAEWDRAEKEWTIHRSGPITEDELIEITQNQGERPQ